MKRFAIALACLVAIPAAVIALSRLGVVGLHYPVLVDNNPLRAPVRVVSVTGSRLELADGRVIDLDLAQGPVADAIATSESWVDVEGEPPRQVSVYVKRRNGICGTPWARPINLPIIPVSVQGQRRELLGCTSIDGFRPAHSQAFSEEEAKAVRAAKAELERQSRQWFDALYKVMPIPDGYSVLVLYVSGYEDGRPLLGPPGAHCEVLISRQWTAIEIRPGA